VHFSPPPREPSVSEQIDALVDALGHTEAPERAAAATKLGDYGLDAISCIPPLLDATWDPDGEVRAEAIRAITRIGVNSELSLSIFSPSVRDRYRATINDYSEAIISRLRLAIRDSHEGASLNAMVALEHLGENARAAIPDLMAILTQPVGSGVENNLNRAAVALGRIDPGNANAIAVLMSLLKHSDSATRESAAYSLGSLRVSDWEVVDALVALVEGDPNAMVRRSAADALGSMAERPAVTVPALIYALSDPHPWVRSSAARALARIDEQPDVTVPALTHVLSDPDTWVRQDAALALSRFGRDARSAIPELLRVSERATGDELETLYRALRGIGGVRCIPDEMFVRLLGQNPHWMIREGIENDLEHKRAEEKKRMSIKDGKE